MTSTYRDSFREEDLQREQLEESDEEFDRLEFAKRALDLVGPARTRVVLCPGSRTLVVEKGRALGRTSPARWAVLYIPVRASRRAIALAALELSEGTATPYALDTLMSQFATR
ncbi:hypothetical protein BH09MYX1_BH09MYX1_27930 [soil metagenome]